MVNLRILALALAMFGGIAAHTATPPTIEDFASRPKVEDVSISPDGRYLALIHTRDGKAMAVVSDRQAGKEQVMRPVLSEPEHFRMTWCHWATNTRLMCGFLGMAHDRFVYGATRLVAVDADGKNMRVLIQNSREAQGQFQDRIVNWNPGPPDTVLIEADEGLDASQLASGVQSSAVWGPTPYRRSSNSTSSPAGSAFGNMRGIRFGIGSPTSAARSESVGVSSEPRSPTGRAWRVSRTGGD